MRSDIKGTEDIKKLVDSFYERAAGDDLLGSIFRRLEYLHRDKESLYQYWEAALLSQRKHGQRNFPGHIGLMVSPRHFIRWQRLFLQTIDDLYAGPNAEKAKVIVIRRSEEFQASLAMFRF